MTNLEQANQIALEIIDNNGYFKGINPRIEGGIPELAHHEKYDPNGEKFLYYIKGDKKLFIKVRIYDEGSDSGTCPRFELSSRYDDVVNLYLHQYPPYKSPNDSLKLFIKNDLPKLVDHDRKKEIFILCYTDSGQGNIGHFWMDNEFLKIVANSGLSITYTVMLQDIE